MSYKVGYKNPPKDSQYKKGESGNPGGKPGASVRNSGDSTELYDVVRRVKRRKISITQGGKTVKRPSIEALLEQMIIEALRGNAKSREKFLNLVEKADLAAVNGQVSEPLHIIITGGLPEE